MIRLITFGGPDLFGPDGRSIRSALEQPKRLALLAYLALAGAGAFRSRDTIIALFWPESDQERARRSLNQSLHMLRRSLGPDVIVTRGAADVGVAADALWCDAVAFEQALKRGDAAAALHLYRGALLPGLFIEAAPEFEQWLDEQRTHFRQRACTAAWTLAEAAEARGQASEAAEWARRSAELAPDDETILQQQVQLLDRIGNRSGAIRVYEMFAARLVKEYNVEPSVESQQLIERVRSRSEPRARPHGSGEDVGSPGGLGTRPSEDGRVSLSKKEELEVTRPERPMALNQPVRPDRVVETPRTRRVLPWRLAVVVASGAFVAGLVGDFAKSRGRVSQFPWRARIIVGRFADTDAPPESATLGRSIAAGIIARLTQVPSFEVIRQGTPSRTEGVPQPATSQVPQLLVTGSVLHSGGRVHVDVQVIDATSGRTLKTAAVEQDSGAALSMVNALSQHMASLVRVVAGHEAQLREWSAETRSGKARKLMQSAMADRERARQLQRPATLLAAIKTLEEADSLLEEVETLVPREEQPIVERANVLEQLGILFWAPLLHDTLAVRGMLQKGIAEAGRALSLNRQDAAALETLGSASYWYWLTIPLAPDSGRRVLASAEQNLRRAVDIDPGRASAWSLLSAVLYMRADFTGAYLAADKAYRADAYLDNAQGILGKLFITSYEIGDDSASQRWCSEMERRFSKSWTSARCRLSLLAWQGSNGEDAIAEAWRIVTSADRSAATPRLVRTRLHVLVAAVLARSGLRDSAEAVIRRARKVGGGDPELLPLEATARIATNEPDSAVQLLTRYVREAPLHRMGVVRSRRFASLRDLDRRIAQAIGCAECLDLLDEQHGPRR